MQPLVFEATFENGVLKPDRPLPLVERQRIKVSVELPGSGGSAIYPDLEFIQETSGMVGWTGDAETVERVALDPEFGRQRNDGSFLPSPDGWLKARQRTRSVYRNCKTRHCRHQVCYYLASAA